MGLLDDAIREHLDLKRRRGADPAEIERAEREALGPVRRGRGPVEADEFPPELGADDYEAALAPGWEEHDEADHEPFPGAFPEDAPAYEQERDYGDPAESPRPLQPDASTYEAPLPPDDPAAYRHPLHDEPSSEADPFAGDIPPLQFESAPPAPHAAPASPRPRSDETAEYDVEEELGKHQEDVLEETPEFLQDAPEHDRLWFEQRPPRDFDFNE